MDAQGDIAVESETMQGVPAFGASGPTSADVGRSAALDVELNVHARPGTLRLGTPGDRHPHRHRRGAR